MSWVKLDDGFYDHPKVIEASIAAIGLHALALSYCGKHLTDGKVSKRAVVTLARGAEGEALAAELVEIGLWKSTPNGYEIHDFLHYNRSADDVKQERSAARERMRKFRRSSSEPTENFERCSSEVPIGSGSSSSETAETSSEALPTNAFPVAETAGKDTAPARVASDPPVPKAKSAAEPDVVDPELLTRALAAFPHFRGDAWRAVLSLVWQDVVGGPPPARKLEPFDALRTQGWRLVRVAAGFRKYLIEKRKETTKYGIEDFVAHVNDWAPARKTAPARAAPSAIPDEKPIRTPEEIANVREIIAKAPFMRRHVGGTV